MMSRKLLIAALVSVGLLLALYGCAHFGAAQAASQASPVKTVFRDFIWGVSKEDVITYETAAFYKEEGDSIFFLLQKNTDYIPSLSPMLRYDFTDGGLTSAQFSYFELKQPDGQIILDLFMMHQMELSSHFGAPAEEEILWKDEYYKNFPQFWARALMEKNLRLRTVWRSGDSEVILQTYRDRYDYKLFYTVAKIRPMEVPQDFIRLDEIAPISPSVPSNGP